MSQPDETIIVFIIDIEYVIPCSAYMLYHVMPCSCYMYILYHGFYMGLCIPSTIVDENDDTMQISAEG